MVTCPSRYTLYLCLLAVRHGDINCLLDVFCFFTFRRMTESRAQTRFLLLLLCSGFCLNPATMCLLIYASRSECDEIQTMVAFTSIWDIVLETDDLTIVFTPSVLFTAKKTIRSSTTYDDNYLDRNACSLSQVYTYCSVDVCI